MKKIKNIIKEKIMNFLNLINNCLYNKPAYINNNFVISTIAFNNWETLEVQYDFLEKNIVNFSYVVIDNSNKNSVSEKIKNWCMVKNISYIKIPFGIRFNPSYSHGYALNFAYNIFLKINKIKYLGFLDHDIYPYRKTEIIKKIREGVFGRLQERDNRWYLWPGFVFFDLDKIRDKKIDFTPIEGLDTGGRLYYSLYSNIKKENLIFPKEYYIELENDNRETKVQVIDDWIHLVNLSNWNNGVDRSFLIKLFKKYANQFKN